MGPSVGLDEVEARLQSWAAERVAPFDAEIDRDERVPDHVVAALRTEGLFASGFPEKLGGTPGSKADPVTGALRHGLVHEALGSASAAVQGLLNVHHMAGSAIARWGSRAQQEHWVPRLCRGEVMAALAVTEPNVGSDAASVETTATPDGAGFRLDGTKTWITCGMSADLFVVLARAPAGPVALMVPRETPGFSATPIPGMLGCRGYMLATLHFEGCPIPAEQVLGRPGVGLSHVVTVAFDAGRHNLAWGCVGLARACLTASFAYARTRRQFGVPIAEHGAVQQMLARMATDVHAARLVCASASRARGGKEPSAAREAFMAKYFASTMVNRVAGDALQIHGANGAGPHYPLARYVRDARIMEIIEGTTQVIEAAIARICLQEEA